MSGISSRTSSSTSSLGRSSVATPERASYRTGSPARTTVPRSDPARYATCSSSPRLTTTARSVPSLSFTLTTWPVPSGSRTSTTLRASFRMTCAPDTSLSASRSGAGITRNFRPAVTTSTDPSSLLPMNTPKVAGGWESFSTSSARASMRCFSSRRASASFSFWPVARASASRVSTSFSSRSWTWRGALVRRRRSSPTSSSRKEIRVCSSWTCFSRCSACSRRSAIRSHLPPESSMVLAAS